MQLSKVPCSGSHHAAITVPARVVVSAEARLGQALHPHSPGCWQYSIPCRLLARDFLCLSFLLGKVGLIFPGHRALSQGHLTHSSTTSYDLIQGCQGSSAIALVDAIGETQVPGPSSQLPAPRSGLHSGEINQRCQCQEVGNMGPYRVCPPLSGLAQDHFFFTLEHTTDTGTHRLSTGLNTIGMR